MLVSACILIIVNSIPTILSKEQRPSKYKAQLFDCGVPGKSGYCRYLKPAVKIPTEVRQLR